MLKGYRTIIFNILMPVLMAVSLWTGEDVGGEGELNLMLDAVEEALVAVWAIGNMVLRAITNTRIGSRI